MCYVDNVCSLEFRETNWDMTQPVPSIPAVCVVVVVVVSSERMRRSRGKAIYNIVIISINLLLTPA